MRSSTRSIIPYSLRPRARQASHCLVGQTLVSKARGQGPQTIPLSRCGRPESIIRLSATSIPEHFGPTPNSLTSQATCSSNRVVSTELSNGILRVGFKENNKQNLIRPRVPFHIGAFNVRTLCQSGQQSALALSLSTFNIDVCCVSETRIQDPSVVMHLKSPVSNSVDSQFTLRVSGDPVATARGLYGVGIALSAKAEAAIADWIPVNSRLCAVRLESSVCVNRYRTKKRCMFIVSAYAPTNSSTDLVKDEFYHQLSDLLRLAKNTDIVVLAGDMNARIGQLDTNELHLGGGFAVDSVRNDNGDRLLQLCTDHQLFLSSTSFQHKRSHRVTWKPPRSDESPLQLDYIAISHKWRTSVQDCRSFWCTAVDSDHALVRARVSVTLLGKAKGSTRAVNARCLEQPDVKQAYQSELDKQLSQSVLVNDSNGGWLRLHHVMESAFKAVCPAVTTKKNNWISKRSADLLAARMKIPPGNLHDSERKSLKRRLSRSLKNDRERWWTEKAREMEKASAIGNSR
ncbi:MAG: endonuclease/exonuclease/phosphatase family protein, partial [Propionibacteriaceae bacterium]